MLLTLTSKFSSILHYDQWFSRYKVAKNRKCTKWPQTELEHLTVKSTLYTLNTYALRSKFWSVSLYNQWFRRYCTFYNSHWPPQKRTKNKLPKIQNLKFTILYTTLVDTLPMSMHEFFEANLLCTFRQDVTWSFFSHMVQCWRKRKCKILKNKQKKNGLEIWWNFPPNLALICLTGSDKLVLWTTDGRQRDDSSSAMQLHKAELKIIFLMSNYKWGIFLYCHKQLLENFVRKESWHCKGVAVYTIDVAWSIADIPVNPDC